MHHLDTEQTNDAISLLAGLLAQAKEERRQQLLANSPHAGVKWVSLEKFKTITGIDPKGRIDRGEWLPDIMYRKLGDSTNGRVVVNLEAYNTWVENGLSAFAPQQAAAPYT